MKTLFLLLSVSFFAGSCFPASKISSTQKNIIKKSVALQPDMFMAKFEQGIDFIASGNEPFWNLEINFNEFIHFKMPGGVEINTPALERLKAIDTNIISYTANNNKSILTVQIQKTACINDMSGAQLPYTVTVSTKNNTTLKDPVYRGCGQYLADYRLQDIWLLDSINHKKIITADFPNGIPILEFNLTEGKAFGNSGCKNISGNMEVKGKKIYFGKLSMSGKACKQHHIEADYLQKINRKIIPYQIKPGKLYLQFGNDSVFIYKKID